MTIDTTARDAEGNLLDGCGAEHSPGTNLGCVAGPDAATRATVEVMADLRRGVGQWEEEARLADEQAKNYDEQAVNMRREADRFRAKAAALSALVDRLEGTQPEPDHRQQDQPDQQQ